MSQLPDEEEDQIFSGKALAADGAVQPAKPIPLLHEVPILNEVPPLQEDSLIQDPAYEPTVISSSRAEMPPHAPEGVELAERAPPPMASDFVVPRPEKPVRYRSPDIAWRRWGLLVLLLAAVGGGGWAVMTGKLSLKKLGTLSLDSLRTGEEPKDAVQKHVATPAPTLLVLSDPSGATVLVGGTEVGVTPWAGDNVWPKEPLRIEVRKAGYKPWQGLTMGGKQETLEATLKRR
ncbi:MAG TPA: PEGA domain-containing protein [Myxococcaceae bacterium]|nr:PEGA domain-containing protein [Myxococcaceae bacterium]